MVQSDAPDGMMGESEEGAQYELRGKAGRRKSGIQASNKASCGVVPVCILVPVIWAPSAECAGGEAR